MPPIPTGGAADPPRGPSDPEPNWWARVHGHLHRNRAMSATTKLVVTLVGTAVLTAGLIMMVTPGPGLVAIVAGLAILATEWDWADRWLTTARRKLHEARLAAEAMDPRVRRRRILLGVALTVLVVAAVAAYVAVADWPDWSVWVWDRAQSFLGFLPELPGM
ncbi:MAG TPA: PGPGW domain-containing protein [Marmoricola sp.]|nr:PGPGW domain-containing protein [Marmoricola sp.]